jgi:alpha-glucuronidase
VSPFEVASGSVAIVTASNSTVGTATTKINFASGTYDLAVNYYDFYGGQSQWQVYLNDKKVGEWVGNSEDVYSHTPSIYLDGHSAIRVTFRGVKVKKGDTLRIVGKPDGFEPAPLDYVSFLPEGIVD